MSLTSRTVHRPTATGIIVLALLVLGVYGLAQLPTDFLPDVTYPLIKVHIWWRGATPEDIETNIADPIERQMATVDGLDYLESSSIEGMYTLQVNFRYGYDIDVAYQDAQAAMARVARELPKDIDAPIVIKADPSQLPIAQITISSDAWNLVKVRDWTENYFQDQLLAVAGVAGTEIVGGLKREIRIHLDPSALEKYGLTLPFVTRRLQEENIEQFGGRVTTERQEFIARTVGEYRTLDDIRAVPLIVNGVNQVYLRDIAVVEDAHEEIRVITRLGGKPCVKLSVLKQADANTVRVAEAVSARLKELEPALPGAIRLGIVENQADYIAAALHGVRNTAIEAAILVVAIIALFLGSWRQIVAMAWALPVTLLLNFGLMKLAGFSLNIFSLGGLVVAIAVDLDNSIIVIENITRWRKERHDLSRKDLVIAATGQVGPAVMAATLSFLALFLPFLLVPGLVSLLFRELVLVIAGVMAISMIMAIAVTPIVMALLLGNRKSDEEDRPNIFERTIERVTAVYTGLLETVLRHPWRTLAASFLFLVVGAGFLSALGSEFLPRMDDGRIMVKVKLPTGVALSRTDDALRQVEKAIADDPLIESYFTLAGGKVWGLYTYEIANEGEVNIQLVPRHARGVSTEEYLKQLQTRLDTVKLPAGKAMASLAKVKGIRRIGEADVEIKIKGQETEKLFSLAKNIAQTMQELKHFQNVYVSMDMNKPEYQVRIDRVRAAALGISIQDVSRTLRTLVGGDVATRFREGSEYYNIRLMIPEKKITSKNDIEDLPIALDGGVVLRIRDVATVSEAVGPVEIVREDKVKEVIVRGDAAGVSVGQAVQEMKSAMTKVELPPGYEISYGGQSQMMAEMRRTVLSIFAFALFFAFVVLVVQFNDLKMPLFIIAGVPVSLAGSIILLFITGLPLGATVIIGILVVVAANVMEGVLLLNYANELHIKEGRSPRDAVVHAARIRFRPRMMTSIGVLVGFLPLALNLEEGGDMLQPMATAAIGGLLATIVVTLFLVPSLYVLFTRTQKGRPQMENNTPSTLESTT